MEKSKTYLVEKERPPRISEMSDSDPPTRVVDYRACIVKDGEVLEWYVNKGIIKKLIKNSKAVKWESRPNETGAHDRKRVYVLSKKDLSTVEEYVDKNLIKSITEGCELQILVTEYITKIWYGG